VDRAAVIELAEDSDVCEPLIGVPPQPAGLDVHVRIEAAISSAIQVERQERRARWADRVGVVPLEAGVEPPAKLVGREQRVGIEKRVRRLAVEPEVVPEYAIEGEDDLVAGEAGDALDVLRADEFIAEVRARVLVGDLEMPRAPARRDRYAEAIIRGDQV